MCTKAVCLDFSFCHLIIAMFARLFCALSSNDEEESPLIVNGVCETE